ncbi:MAG: hypothetical protein PHP95_04520 [Desulfuromonadaceae bacterium]|nr:hypothetical protein [Desulfuromonadaceae bacterium]MDD2847701.1 hypothetical protein [Desulfuromonadaceae bacterium]MDD4131053.1 hypothetical protein [Desulfuromonadaceae bacterium]
MLIVKKFFFIVAALALSALPAAAASIGREKPSNFAVWAFLTLCGLVIVAQVLPLIRDINEEAKSMAAKAKEKEKLEVH